MDPVNTEVIIEDLKLNRAVNTKQDYMGGRIHIDDYQERFFKNQRNQV